MLFPTPGNKINHHCPAGSALFPHDFSSTSSWLYIQELLPPTQLGKNVAGKHWVVVVLTIILVA